MFTFLFDSFFYKQDKDKDLYKYFKFKLNKSQKK